MRYKKLVGNKLYLAPLEPSDAPTYLAWFEDFRLTDGIGNTGVLFNIKMEENWLENATSNGEYTFGIIDKETDELVGNVGLMNIDHINRKATLGIFIGEEKYRSKGYGSEAINLILEYGFRYLNLHNINLSVNSFNDRAIACYEKVGFKKSGIRRESVFNNGKYYDQIFMDYLDTEFNGDFIKNKVKRD